jgi:hypothetical protein
LFAICKKKWSDTHNCFAFKQSLHNENIEYKGNTTSVSILSTRFDYLIKHLLFVQKKFAIDIQKLIGAKKICDL